MMVIMEEHQEKEQQNISHNSFCSSFSRIRSEELNDMGYSLSRISPITFNGDAFQTPSNRAQDKAPMLTPRKERRKLTQNQFHSRQGTMAGWECQNHINRRSIYRAGNGRKLNHTGRFVPPTIK